MRKFVQTNFLEYANVVWDQHTRTNINKVEMIQNRAVCGIFYKIFRRRDIAWVLRCLWRRRKAGGQGKNLEFGLRMHKPRQWKKDSWSIDVLLVYLHLFGCELSGNWVQLRWLGLDKSLVALGVTEGRQVVTFCSWVLHITVELVAHSTVWFISNWKRRVDSLGYNVSILCYNVLIHLGRLVFWKKK